MVEIKLHEVIDSESNAWIYDWMGMNRPFTLETLQEVLEQNPNQGIKLNIHCDGGNVEEGLAIYDALRTSGRKIRCNVEGKCHSMAIVLLLAAPKEDRTANPNAQFLIHEVSGGVAGNVSSMEKYVEEARDLQNRILDIYADRTGYDRAELEQIMKEEKMRDSAFMLEHGFIGSINAYNTNSHKNMNLIESIKNLLKTAEQEGVEQNAAPAVNEEKVTELNNKIAEQEAKLNEANEQIAVLNAKVEEHTNTIAERDARIAELEGEIANINAEREQMQNTIAEREQEITDLKSQIGSNYKPEERNAAPSSQEEPKPQTSREEQKNAIREAMKAMKK